MREHLLGYLLGALDAAEHEDVQRHLERNPQLQQDLDRLRQRVDPLRSAPADLDPPAGLADRTLFAILGAESPLEDRSTTSPWDSEPVMPARTGLTGAMSAAAAEPSPAGNWSMIDSLVAVGVVCVAAMLFFPTIANSRSMARIEQCGDNLRQLSSLLFAYSDLNGKRELPIIPAEGELAFAGSYAIQLAEKGLLPNPQVRICPDSETAEPTKRVRVPTPAEFAQANEHERDTWRRLVGGSYGYTLGYWDGERHVPHRHLGRSHLALMSDAPSWALRGESTSNHGRKGQNMLYDDGHIAFIAGSPADTLFDHPYRNRYGRVAVGVDQDDAVIAPSHTAPVLLLNLVQ